MRLIWLLARVHLGEFPRMSLHKTERPDVQKPTKYNFIETIKSFAIKAVILLEVHEQSWTYDADNNNINNNNKTNNSGTSLVMGLVQRSCQSERADIGVSRVLKSCSNTGQKTKVKCNWVEFEEIQTELNKTKKGKHKGENVIHQCWQVNSAGQYSVEVSEHLPPTAFNFSHIINTSN